MFVGTGIIPSTAQNIVKPSLLLNGKILYVGGSGPGNYSKIQDAVDNASNGDTVYVFDDSSPYIENIIINKSINLTGENSYSTIIENSYRSGLIKIISDNVTISGFTLQNFLKWGVYCSGKNFVISHNRIIDDEGMGIVSRASNVKIFNNEFTCFHDTALDIWDGDNIDIYRNNFTECIAPFYLSFTTRTHVYENNFLSYKNAFLYWDGEFSVAISPSKTKFYQNYWYQPRVLPKLIFGGVIIDLTWIFNFPFGIMFPWILVDSNPAIEPYNIGR